MEKKIEEMTLNEAMDELEYLFKKDGCSDEELARRKALFEHMLALAELETGGEG